MFQLAPFIFNVLTNVEIKPDSMKDVLLLRAKLHETSKGLKLLKIK